MPTAASRASFRPLVPAAVRQWALDARLPLAPLVDRLLELAAVVLPVVDVPPRTLPSVDALCRALALPSTAADPIVGAVASTDVPAEELRSYAADDSFARCPVIRARLRAYARSCVYLFPDVRSDQLVFLVTAYAVAVGLPPDFLQPRVTGVLLLPPPVEPVTDVV